MSLLNHKQVKAYFKSNGKQVSTQALQSLEDMVQLKLRASIENARQFKRVTETEVLFAFGGVK